MMRKIVVAIFLCASAFASLPAHAQSDAPTLTVDQITCEPITQPLGTATFACVDFADGVDFRIHQQGNAVWLEVIAP